MKHVGACRERSGNLSAFWIVLVATGLCAGGVGLGCRGEYETRVILPEEGGPPKEAGAFDASPAAMCPTDVPVDVRTLGWKLPNAPQEDKCQEDDIAAVEDFLAKNPSASNEDFKNFVKNRDAVCHDCIFGDADGTTWPPAPVKNGQVLTFNVGACYALTTGSPACGRAVQHAWDCEFEACTRCDSPAAVATCRAKARTGVCLAYGATANADCAGPSADGICGSPFDSIRVQCMTTVPPGKDAGTD